MRVCSVVLLILALSSSAMAGDRAEEWAEDLRALGTQLGSVHAKYRQCGIPPSLRSDLDDLSARAASLSDTEVTVEVQRILASVGDGHTLLFPFGMKRGGLRRLPVMLWQFDDGVFIVQSETAALVGRQVIGIGDLTTDELMAKLQKYISHDNEMQLRWAAPFYATLTDFLSATGATATRDEATLVLDRGERITLKSEDIDPERLEIKLPTTVNGPALYLSHRASPFWQTKLDDRTLYVQVNAIDDDNGKKQTLNEFGKLLRPLLANVGHLVLDLRFNSGGEARKANELLKTLIWFDAGGGHIAVLTSRMTFSAAQTLATRLDEWTDAVFVGEATGSRPNHYGNERPFKLPNAGLRGTIASGFNQPITANDERLTIQPDIPMRTTSADYFAGRDPVLEAALKRWSSTAQLVHEAKDVVGHP